MALIKSVRDEEERKRKQQAQANQTAQTAANKSAQMNSDAAKRNSAGASKAPTQSAADTIKAAKEKAKTGTVTKTPKQYANPAQYVKKSNPVRQTFNYETLGTQERVDQVASWIVDPKEKQGFLDGWTAYTNTKSYKNQQKRKEQLQGLNGLYDANGRPINVNTASYSTVVQGIRSIADAAKRKEAAAKLEEMTKTWGSRFYGQTYTKDIVTSYLGNPDFTEEDYKDEAAAFENAFYAQSGYEEQNTQTYIDSIMDIRNSGYSDSVQRQLKQRLDEVWKNTTGKKLPNLNEVSADLVNEYYERAKKQQEEEAAGDTKSWWENLIGFLGFGEEDEPEEKTEEQPTTSGGETKSSLPGGAVEMGKVASGSVVDVAPNMASYTKPEDVSYTARNGTVDLSGDPIKAIIQYADKGLSGSLNAATKAAIDKYVHSSAGISAMWGVLSNENLNEYAYVGEDGKIASEKGNRLASDIYRDNYGILGSKMSSYALKIKDSSFPAVLREDAAGVLSIIIQQAETEAQLLPEQYDPDFVNIYDQFLENHPSAVDALAEAFAYEGEMKRANREAQALAAAEEQANKQKAIETSVEACRTGNGTVEDWDRVAELAAKVTKDQLYDDDFYMDMLTEIGIARSMSDRDLTNLDDWYNEKTTGWLLANGVDNDLTKVPAIQYKDFLNGHVRDALDQVAATAYSLGYKSLAEYNEKTGVLSGDLLYQIAWNNIQKAEKTTTDEVVDEANRIAYKGTDDSFGRTVEGIAYGMKTGFVDQTMAEGYEAIYNFAVSTNLDVDAARVRIKYINEYGYANAASAYIDHMTQLADGGYFPSEELTNYVKQALAGDGDAFALGIMPEDMGWAVEGAKEAQQKVADYQDWAQENLTEAQGLLSSIAVSTGHNTATQLIARGMNLVFGGFGAAGQVISSMAAYGGFGGEFNETFKKSLGEHSMRESNLLGLTNSLAMSIANLETDKKFSGKVLDLLGVNTAVEMAVEEMGMPAATNIWKAMIGAFGKGTAKNLFDEVIHDEVMEGLWKNGLGAGVEYLLDATEGAVKLPNIQDVFLAGINALVNIDAIGTMEDVIGNAPEAAIYMLPMAIMSGIVDGAQEWKSYKSLKQAAKTGDPADAKQAVEDLAEDLADPEKGKALSEGVNDAKKGKVAAQIMLKDEEISPLFEQAQMDFEQAKAHEAKAEANQASIDTAVKTMMEAQERLDNGTGDDSDAQAIVDASEAIAKNKAGLDEAKREAQQKRDAGNKLYERITNIAMAKAGKQVSDERTAAAEELTAAQQEREAQTEADNVTAMEADNFIEQRYAGLPEEQKQRLREIYADTVKGKVNADFKAVDAAVRQFQKKFSNINFKVVDSLAGAEGGYVRDKNTVYIARDMTHSEIVNRVLIHELTHASEGGGKAYEEFRDALLRHKYKGDDAMIEADKASIAKRYNDHYAKNNIIDEKTGKVRIADDDEVMTELVADITGKILSGDEEAVNRLIAEEPTAARRIWDTIKRVLGKLVGVKGQGIDDLRRVEQLFAKALNQAQTKQRAFGTDGIQYSIREKQPPKNVVYAYKAFYARDGKLYPPMVANITDESDKQKVKGATSGTMKSLPTPVGVWLDADVGGIMTDENGEPVRAKDTKRLRVKNDKSGGSATLAFRPGWHLGEWPDAKQFNKADPETGERGKRMPDDLVFAKCEVSADIDYQLDALSYGINEKGGFSRSQAGLPEIPEDGYYKYRTNVDPTTAPWLIAGSIKVTEILDDDDCARICAEFGVTPDKRVSGEKIDLAKYGLKRGPVEETTEGMEKFRENDANRANKALLERALSDPNYPNAYVKRDIDFDNPAQYEQLKKEFAMNGQDIEQYKKLYEARGFASERRAQPVAESKSTGEPLVGEINGSAMQFSLRSWTDDERDTSLNQAVESIDVEELDSAYKQAVEDENFFLIEDYFAKAAAKYAKDFDSSSYENVPDSLMGFRRNGSNKPYFEQKYGQYVTVYVSDEEGDAFVDVVRGQNVKHAMERAKRNWPDMDVKLLSTNKMDSVEFDENGELIPLSKRFSALAYEDTFVDNDANYLENMSEKDYNRFGWVRGNDVISPASWRRHDSLLANIKSGSVKASKNADGMLVSSITDDNGIENIVVVSDGDTQSPTVERIFKIEKEFEDLVEGIRNAIKHAESRYGKDSGRSIERFIADGLVKRYSPEDFPTLAEHTRAGSNGKTEEVQGLAEIEQERRGNAGEAGNGVIGRMQRSLPSDDVLTQEIQAYHELQSQPEAEQAQQIPNQNQPQRPQGERQFTVKTLQNSQAVPQWLKNALYNDPQARFYEKDTNNDQIVRSWQRLQSEGYEAMRDRLLSENAQLNNADDVADANMVMAMAEHEGDVQTFLDMALHYAQEGTREAQALQARKIFSKMTPTGMKVWVSGQAERNLAGYIEEHKPVKKKVDRAAKKVEEKIKDLQGGDELLRLQAASEYTITDENNRWGVPINEKQRALIKEYGLEKVARPGVDYYNRATTKQRMLEAILAEPNPENVTGNGLNLIQRLEYMKEGAAVVTNADLDYMGRQMALFAHSPVDDQEGRIGDLALARLYEAYGNITPATMAEKAKTWRYTSMLLSVPSSLRNVIGNAAQNTVNATAHGVAHAIDWGVSKVTGERTVAGLTFKERADGWATFRDETVNTFRDFYTDKAITNHGEDRHNLNQRGRVYQNGTLEMLRLTEGFLMSVGDRNFWKKAYVNSLAEQQRVADLNGEAFDYEVACERAEAEANYATFNEDSRVRDWLAQLKNPPEDAPLKDKVIAMAVDFLMPFTGVPTNITKRMIDYSPAGLAFTAIEHGVKAAQGKNFDQNAFVNGMARGLTGTALLAIGMELFKAGLVSLGTGDEEDKKIYGAETAQGRQYTPYIRVGDQYIALSTFMPAASAIIMGATAQKVFENDEDALNAIKSACFASLDMIFDASYMSSLADIFGGYGTLGENAVDSLVNSTISQNVPAILGQVASAMDPYVRDTKDKDAIMQALKSGLISKIPGLRQQLEAKVDITGEKVRNSKYMVAPIDPFTRSYANDDPVLQELIDFARESGETSVIPELFVASNKYEVKVTKTQAKSLKVNRSVGENGKRDYQALSLNVSDEEKWALNEQYGKLVFGELTKLVESRKWKRADEKERVTLAKDIIAEAKLDVLEDFLKERGVE